MIKDSQFERAAVHSFPFYFHRLLPYMSKKFWNFSRFCNLDYKQVFRTEFFKMSLREDVNLASKVAINYCFRFTVNLSSLERFDICFNLLFSVFVIGWSRVFTCSLSMLCSVVIQRWLTSQSNEGFALLEVAFWQDKVLYAVKHAIHHGGLPLQVVISYGHMPVAWTRTPTQ